jgi:galactokinase
MLRLVINAPQVKSAVYQHPASIVNLPLSCYNQGMDIINEIENTFQKTFGSAPVHIVRAPGRVNLLGEHVDYNDGFVLPAAIDRATYIAYSPSDSHLSSILAVDMNDQASFSLETIRARTQEGGLLLPEWALYSGGVLWALGEEGLETGGMKAVFASNVPRGSGLSSSASVEMAFLLAWQTLGGWTLPPMKRALLGQKAENRYVGVNCGIMDQFASACGVENNLLLLDCRSLEWKTIPLPEDVSIVIADTTVRRKLTSGEYNKRRFACEEAVRLLKQDLPEINSLRDVSVEDFNRFAGKLPKEVYKRARHVVEELERSRQAEPLLEAGNVYQFGELMNQCHVSLRDFYEVSCPELDVMVNVAQALEGCYGARLTGAGFGGCTVNLVARESADLFAKALARGYQSQTRLRPEIYITRASNGAEVLK